jgi:hypothetical protein
MSFGKDFIIDTNIQNSKNIKWNSQLVLQVETSKSQWKYWWCSQRQANLKTVLIFTKVAIWRIESNFSKHYEKFQDIEMFHIALDLLANYRTIRSIQKWNFGQSSVIFLFHIRKNQIFFKIHVRFSSQKNNYVH